MRIVSKEWVLNNGYPGLVLGMDTGFKTNIPFDQKKSLIDRGIVFLGADWEGRVPSIYIADALTIVQGCTSDPAVFLAWKEWQDALEGDYYVPGPKPV